VETVVQGRAAEVAVVEEPVAVVTGVVPTPSHLGGAKGFLHGPGLETAARDFDDDKSFLRQSTMMQPSFTGRSFPPPMDTDERMALALEMVGFTEVPADSQIHVPGTDLRRLLVGIDIGGGELLLAREQGFDGVIAHHPAGGRATVHFHRVLRRHAELMEEAGVPPEEAREAVEALSIPQETARHAANYDRIPAFARFLRLPFLNIHQPWDEMGRQRMVGALKACDEDATVEDGVAALHALPEFGVAETDIVLRLGDAAHPLGRWAVAHGAGTNGGFPVAKAYFSHGVDTLVYIHILPADLQRLREDPALEGKTLMVTGHIASDSLGITPYIQRLREEGLEVVALGGVLEP
jgi:hypothetical protein